MKFLIYFILIFYPIFNAIGFDLETGVILFQDGNDNGFNDAVKGVTSSVDGYNFSHCGIYYVDTNGKKSVIEAFNDGVVLTDIDVFMNRYLTNDLKPKIVVGRLVDTLHSLIPYAIKNALIHLGKSYDYEFDLENDKIYCSELIYFAYRYNSGDYIFETNPMTFICVDNEVQSYWQEYFKLLGVPVPEGKEGINPGAISRSKHIKIVHYYYN